MKSTKFFFFLFLFPFVLFSDNIQIDLTERMPVELLFHTLGESYGVNIIVSPEVRGDSPILSLKNLSFEEALDTISSSLGLIWEKKGSSYVVKQQDEPELEKETAEIFFIKHIGLETAYEMLVPLVEKEENISFIKEAKAIKVIGTQSIIETVRKTLEKVDTESTARIEEEIITEQFTPEYLTIPAFVEGVEPFLKQDDIEYTISAKTKTLTVTAPVKTISKISQFLKIHDKQTAPETAKRELIPQVMIESQFVEFTENSARGFNVDWEINKIKGDAFEPYIPGTSRTIAGRTSGDLLIGLIKQKPDYSFIVTLDTYIREGRAKILVAPRAAAMDGETAMFKYSREYNWWEGTPYFNVDGELTRITYSLGEPVEVNISLEVTPEINTANKTVTVTLHPVVQDVIEWVPQPDAPLVKVPNVASQETTTRLRIKDGDTIAIGGLKRERDEKDTNKIPLLGDIPLLGYLFQQKTKTAAKSDLIIFLTVKIMKDKPEEGNNITLK